MAASHKEYLWRAVIHSLISLHKRAVHPCHPLSIASGRSPVNLQSKSLLCVYFSFLFYSFLETCIYYLGSEPTSKEQTVLWQKRWDILPWISLKQWPLIFTVLSFKPPRLHLTRLHFPETHFSSSKRVKEELILCVCPKLLVPKPFCSMFPFSMQVGSDVRAGGIWCVILVLRLLGIASSVDAELNKTVSTAEIKDYAKCNCSPV